MNGQRFEDLDCWKEARILTRSVYAFTKNEAFATDKELCELITRASVEIMKTICTGFDSRSNNEYVRCLNDSMKSCSEVQNCLYIALDQGYINESDFQDAYGRCGRIREMIDGMIRYL